MNNALNISNYYRREYDTTYPGSRGNTFPIYNFLYSSEEEKEEEDKFDVESDVTDDVARKIRKRFGTKSRDDIGGRTDKGDRIGTNIGGVSGRPGLYEYFNGVTPSDHTTTAMSGISPRMYRSSTGSRISPSPQLGAQGSAKYIRSKNTFQIGNLAGRPHKLLTDIEDENIESLTDLLDKHERSFLRQQKKVNKVKRLFDIIEDK